MDRRTLLKAVSLRNEVVASVFSQFRSELASARSQLSVGGTSRGSGLVDVVCPGNTTAAFFKQGGICQGGDRRSCQLPMETLGHVYALCGV